MGWVVGFEPTYTGATTLGLNHLTIPTMLANFVHYCVTASLALSYVRRYVPFGSHSACLVLREIICAYRLELVCITVLLRCCFIRSRLRTSVRALRFSFNAPCTARNSLRIQSLALNNYCVAASLALSYVRRYVPFGSRSAHLALRTIPCAYSPELACITARQS